VGEVPLIGLIGLSVGLLIGMACVYALTRLRAQTARVLAVQIIASAHHDDLRIDTPYTLLVAVADSISASRPGARRETLEKYVRRLEELETLALGFPGVEQAYAIQAGREIRVLVDSQQLGDAESAAPCREIARSIESSLT
jgi:ribonucrease Y